MSIWEFVSTLKSELHIRQAFTPKLTREHDVAIMEVFLSLNLPPSSLKVLNACRCFLQVITVADIATADGTKISTSAKNGILGSNRMSTLLWPKQSRSPDQAWALWRNCLKILESNDKLIKPLGKWMHPTHQKWSWFKIPHATSVFH
jgi:hypothetical protein